MDKKLKLKTELLKKLKKETSGTGTGASVTPGTGAGVATKYAFGKRTNKGTPSDWKNAPSIPNRKSKAMDYKELWEGKMHIGTDTKTDSDIYFEPSTGIFSINVVDGAGNRTNKLQVNTIDDVLAKFPNWKWTEQGKAEFSDALNEGYARFRNETKTRTKPEQFHQAVKEVKKKVNEINRLFEYMDRLKSELNEGEELKYKKYTEKSIQQIKESTKQLFFKSTKLK